MAGERKYTLKTEVNSITKARFKATPDRVAMRGDDQEFRRQREAALESQKKNYLADTKVFKAIVLKVESPGSSAAQSAIRQRIFLNGGSADQEDDFIAVRCCIPKLHAMIPKPERVPPLDDDEGKDKAKIQMYPLMVANLNSGIDEGRIKPGATVLVMFAKGPNEGDQTDGTIIDIYQDNQVTTGDDDDAKPIQRVFINKRVSEMPTLAETRASERDYTRYAAAAAIARQERDAALEKDAAAGVSYDRAALEVQAREIARSYGLPEEGFVAQIRKESGFDPYAVSPAGAQGIAQIMPGTQRDLGVDDPFNPQQSLDAGARYMKQIHEMFNQRNGNNGPDGVFYQPNYAWALAALGYNWGPGRVKQWLRGDIPTPSAGTEQAQYVAALAGAYGQENPLEDPLLAYQYGQE